MVWVRAVKREMNKYQEILFDVKWLDMMVSNLEW